MKLVKGFINRIRTSDYTKSLLVLTGGTFIAQLIPIIFYPIIGRLFTPDQIGTAAIFSQIAAILAILVTGGYTYSIFISKSKEEAFNIIVLVLSLSIFVLSVICLTFYFLRDEIHLLLNEPLFVKLFFIPILIALFIVIYQCYNEWCVKNKYFKQLSVNKLVNSSSLSIAETLFGCMNSLVLGNGKVYGELIGRGISAFSCLFSMFVKDRNLYKIVSLSVVEECLTKYIRFPKYVMTGKLINSVSCAIPLFYLGAVFTKEELGFFSMSNTIIAVPISIITIAVSDAYRQRANEDYNNYGSCRNILVKTIVPISIISLVGFSILFIISPFLFEIILGSQWINAGIYTRYLIPMVAISFVTEVIRPTLIIASKQSYDFIWQLLFLFSMLLLIVISNLYRDIYVFLLFFSGIKSLLFLLQFYWCYRYSVK